MGELVALGMVLLFIIIMTGIAEDGILFVGKYIHHHEWSQWKLTDVHTPKGKVTRQKRTCESCGRVQVRDLK